MKHGLQTILVVITIILTASFCMAENTEPLSSKTQTSKYSQMTFKELDSIVRQKVFVPGVELDNFEDVNSDWPNMLREYRRRIKAAPDSLVSFSALKDKTLNPRYRQHLLFSYSESTSAMSPATLTKLVAIMEQLFIDPHEDELVREAAMSTSNNFILAAKRKGLVDDHYIAGFTKKNMEIILDDSESSAIRLNAVHALRSRRQRSEAPKLLELLTSGTIDDNMLKRKIMALLGEWKYQELLPVASSFLKNSDDPKIRRSAAYALGNLGSPEIISPLLTCIEDKRDSGHRCQSSINKNAPLLNEMLQSGSDEKVFLALKAYQYVRKTSEELEASLASFLDNDNPEFVLLAAKRLVRDRDPDLIALVLGHLKGASGGSELEIFWSNLDGRANATVIKLESADKSPKPN